MHLDQITLTHTPFQVRVRVEHAFASLKGRFQSLRELRTHIRTAENLKYTVHWVQCCLILHNMVIHFETQLGLTSSMPWAQQEVSGINRDPELVVVPESVAITSPGQRCRARLMNALFRALGEPYVVDEGEPSGSDSESPEVE